MVSQLPERLDQVEKTWELHLKGYKITEIASTLSVTRVQAKSLLEDAKILLAHRVDEDPDFLSKLEENTRKALDEIDLLTKEAWETFEYCKQQEMANQQVNALKLIQGLAETRARLSNLLGSNVDASNVIQMRKLERVNEIVSSVIKEIVSTCDHCRLEAQLRLAEAFKLMEREDEIIHIQPAQIQLPMVEEIDESILENVIDSED